MNHKSGGRQFLFFPIEHLLDQLRLISWVIPFLMSLLGISYILFENRLHADDPGWPQITFLGMAILGFIGPAIAWRILKWVHNTSTAYVESQTQLSKRAEELATLNNLSVVSGRTLDLNIILKTILEQTVDALDAEAGMIFIKKEDQSGLELTTYQGISIEMAAKEAQLNPGHCLCGQAVELRQALFANDIGKDVRCTSDLCICEGFRSVACAPLQVKGKSLGLLQLASSNIDHFNPDQQGFLTTVSAQVSVSIENAKLYNQVQSFNLELERKVNQRTTELEAAQWALAEKARQLQQLLNASYQIQENTQERIAHDIHDGVTQMVMGALYETQAAKEALGVDIQIAEANLLRAQQFLTEVDAAIRQVIYDLHPPVLNMMGLVVALKRFITTFAETFNIECRIDVAGEQRRLPKHTEIAFFRILQAALQNTATHAQAKSSVITFNFYQDCFEAVVLDDGKGFNPQEIFSTPGIHMGLISMKERAESIGADLWVTSTPGEGTQVAVRLPLPEYIE